MLPFKMRLLGVDNNTSTVSKVKGNGETRTLVGYHHYPDYERYQWPDKNAFYEVFCDGRIEE